MTCSDARFSSWQVSIILTCMLMSISARGADSKSLSPEDLWKFGRVGEVAICPDGIHLAYLITRFDLAENEGKVDLIIGKIPSEVSSKQIAIGFGTPQISLAEVKTRLSQVKGLNGIQWHKHNDRWRLLYVAPSTKEPNEPQVWTVALDAGEPKQLTEIAGGVGNLKVSPTHNHVAFTIDVKLDPTVQEIYPDLPKADARIIDGLMYRHWNAWHDYAYSHVHVAKIQEDGSIGPPLDLMAGMRFDCPLPPFGGADEFNFSPDGRELALSIKAVNNPAESTDSSVFLVSIDGGTMTNISVGMPGYDKDPIYSPDGLYLAFQSMERASFEADRNRIMLYDRTKGSIVELTSGLDQTTHNIRWNSTGTHIFFDSEYSGTQQVYSIAIANRHVEQLTEGQFDFHLVNAVPNSNRLIATQQNMLRPNELVLIDAEAKTFATLTDVNGELLANYELPEIQERWFRSTDGKQVHNWLILPPKFDPSKKYPMLVYCQGGPQGQVGQFFSFRWNFHLMAAKGYVVLAVNRRGLPGFGQEWNDQISGDWGGQAMQDILASTDGMLTESFVDSNRLGAVGASFGGYTVYWLMGNSQDRFKAMISHCGVFNLESMYGSTEELFFTNFDLGGPYWRSDALRHLYDRFSPHRFVGNWRTPLLVIHGEKDFRVPITQGLEAFTAAQVQGVPSRFLYFPNEGHWVSKPQNSVLWQRVFFDWLDRYLKP